MYHFWTQAFTPQHLHHSIYNKFLLLGKLRQIHWKAHQSFMLAIPLYP